MTNLLAVTAIPDRSERALLAAICAQGYKLTILTRNAQLFDGPEFSAARVEQFEVKSRFDFSAAGKIRAIVRTEKIDIIHSFTARTLTVALFGTIGQKVKHITYRGTMGRLSRFDPLSWLSFLNRRISRISCVSEAVREFLLSLGVPKDRAVTIYKGHDVGWYQTLPEAKRADFNIPEDAVVGGFLGNMRWVKGADILLRAMDLLPDDSKIHLLLIGEIRDHDVTDVLNSLRHKAQVHELGFRKDGAALLRLCDFTVMPSREREGFPRAVVEGMAQGVPAIVSRVGGMPELVEANVSGLVVEPNDPKGLADAMHQLESNPALRAALGEAAKRRIITKFPIERTIEQTIALYSV